MKEKTNKSLISDLPPRLPQNDAELKRAIILLGNRKQVELNKHAQRELEKLIGVYPTVKEAKIWKRLIRRACQSANLLSE
ncbi:MAG TPA: hypothetical protein VJT71_15495 [Pyrinomonadaceae bacterium]|nr:hypothetical protein [Pyrinomonadaceae bacterium]